MDPYKVLGVSPNASNEEIKQAYHTLVKKYHPDNYVNNPIADLAAEKMKEINTAYDMIMKMRNGNGGSNSYDGSSGYSGGNQSYAVIRNYISYGNLDKAEELLMQITDRNADWYFLMGSIYYRRGWMDQAHDCFRQASAMDPGNPEYSSAYSRMAHQRDYYRSRRDYNGGGMSACDCCSSLICADCCCECMGGDLISCC
jgi:curved DNA-binding protein CbpA